MRKVPDRTIDRLEKLLFWGGTSISVLLGILLLFTDAALCFNFIVMPVGLILILAGPSLCLILSLLIYCITSSSKDE